MKIASTDLALFSDHAARTREHSTETLRAWRGERPDFEGMQSAGMQSAITRISDAARQLFAAMPAAVPPSPTFAPAPNTSAPSSSEAQAIESANDAVDNDPFLAMIRQMVEFLTGEKVRVFDMQEFSAEMQHVESQSSSTSASLQSTDSGRAGRAGYGVEYDYHSVYEEFETTSFTAEGIVRTADGQEISFKLDIEMTRYYREETNISLRAGDAVRKDPLVVNFDGTASQLSGQANRRFNFDLNGDGKAESLPQFASGSGYLALDLNRNGRIDSGKELFGPQSGNGFAELALLDNDGNGWIDENDKDFNRLEVWTPAEEGAGKLQTLTELGIGALSLAHVATPFALRGDDNADLGIVKSSGFYLTESGQTGVLQEIDLTI